MNGWLIGGVVINHVVALAVFAGGELPAGFGIFLCGLALLSLVGAVLVGAGARKPGAILVIIGSALFVPIGMVGVLGGRKVLDALKREEFKAVR